VYQILKRKGIFSSIIVGETAPQVRSTFISSFQSPICKSPRILLVQMKCGKFGLDLSAASTAIYYSNGFSLEDRLQSEDRIVSPTKKDPLLFIDLLTQGTVDESILRTLKKKNITSRSFMEKLMEDLFTESTGGKPKWLPEKLVA
jgi:SNF2 family DNA or RNA helicase